MWQNGDERAFEALYKRYVVYLVNRVIAKVKDKEIAKDLVQDVMMQLYLRRDQLHIHTTLKGYLLTALRNRFFNYKREMLKMQLQSIEEIAIPEIPGNNVSDYLNHKEVEEKLQTAIAGLPEQCRKVFVLSREHSFSNREIANELGISMKTVEQHITKALRTLRNHKDFQALCVLVFCYITKSSILP
ncbi:hypothetical protein A9P82_10125 [Arachidicoccus ginsenosidimutans]|uniref:RNA polymerase sigma-70 factor n=1 Tax=Arachidicoccus sp. BS20 TaxID=1850526 RepID=UPI0007F0CDDC|nr:RNA polymerase sigma-70 factor [Arachidicoccus sp. BS20]ANI89614.1 hypothetical protein A9P82_10125 [Arachidicoccus sp. BS20]